MLSGYHRKTINIFIPDPTADKVIPLLRVPTGHTYTVEEFYVVPDTAAAANAGTYWEASLQNGGTAGTGTTVISGTAGGTAGWTALTAQSATIVSGSGDLTAGQYLNLNYAETGTISPGNFTVMLEVVDGIGSKA